MRSKIVAGNWKMNKNLEETEVLLAELSAKLPDTKAEVMVAPTFVNLAAAVDKLKSSTIEVIAQNVHFAENGAYTGEISADRKSIRLNSSHVKNSYAVFCLNKKNKRNRLRIFTMRTS